MKLKKNYLKGSYTVEASLVITIIMFVLAALIFCTFYIHDRATLQAMVCEAAAVGSSFATDEEREEAVQKVVGGIEAGRFLGSRNLNGNVAMGKKEITVLWNTEYPVPGFAAKYLAEGKLEARKSWTCKILDPADTIRIIKGAGELLTGGDQ